MNERQPVFINLLAIARYDQMPDYPIQFMTVGDLQYTSPEEAVLQYEETQQDEETGEMMKADISLSFHNGKVTMERKGEFSNTMVFSKGHHIQERLEDMGQSRHCTVDIQIRDIDDLIDQRIERGAQERAQPGRHFLPAAVGRQTHRMR